ncbi:hypothetical protein NUW54_g1295 [Trametes sanguinea]|uniref:Uncharacterized protein n=1 Tax=Trametes sanguinea TaxID=158606 RepID=A0ACC1Q954_9APHY|nr:hypothetical protein NUW54_g1295 [Trametes sanguinea]
MLRFASHPRSFIGLDGYSDAEDDTFAELEDSLEEFEEGLDVLTILEKAYEISLRSPCPPGRPEFTVQQRDSRLDIYLRFQTSSTEQDKRMRSKCGGSLGRHDGEDGRIQ